MRADKDILESDPKESCSDRGFVSDFFRKFMLLAGN